MPRITFRQPDGTEVEIEAVIGDSVMETAVDNDVPGIVAECGGACSCATCHVYVDAAWYDKLPPPEPQEDGMLDCAYERRETSRLSCQIEVGEELDGLIVTVPEEQL